MERQPRSTAPAKPELRNPGETYRRAFLNVMASRGLEEALGAIEEANCHVVLEARPDDEDGAIELTGELKTALFAPFTGLRSPGGDTEPVLVTKVYLGLDVGVIEIGSKLVDYVDGPKTSGYITLPKEGDVTRAMPSEIYFDFVEGKYDVDVIKVDDQGQVIEENEERKRPLQITDGMMSDLASLLTAVNGRTLSKASIYKNAEFPQD